MVAIKFVLVLFLVLLLVQECKFWRRRRRRRSPPPCGARDCSVSAWSNWGGCSHQCGNSGISTRTRHRTVNEACGGRCPYQLRETRPCNRNCPNGGTPQNGRCSCRPGLTGTCCRQECELWLWRRRRRRRPVVNCIRRDCTVSAWSEWGACTHQCGNNGVSARTRSKRIREQCKGQCRYHMREARPCNRLCPNGGSPRNGWCSCRPGFTGKCCTHDVNECLRNPCQHICTNTFGSFTCKCHACYTKVGTRCDLRQCKIANRCYSYNTVNPSNACQKCSSSNKMAWSNDNSLPCNDGQACTRSDRCSNGRCVGTPFTCLPCQECHSDACRVKPGYCLINHNGRQTCFTHRQLRPNYPCQQCDSNNKFRWTNNNNLPCSDNRLTTRNDRCVNGACVGTPYNCLPCEQHDGSGCPLKSGHCIITHQGARTCFANQQLKPGNPCQWCSSSSSTSSWSNRNGVSCNDGNLCTRGDTCTGGQCRATPFTCNSLCQSCNGNTCSLKTGFGYVNGKCTCRIGGSDYNHQVLNPSNQCQWCDLHDASARTKGEWTNRPTVSCDDGNKCTKRDTCNAGRCTGQPYSCQASYPSSSCIQRSLCVGDGTCRDVFKTRGTICRAAVDNCDQPERCSGNLGGCPAAITDRITLTTGSVRLMSQQYTAAVSYQYFTNTLYLNIAGFSSSCGSLTLKWFLLDGTASCLASSATKGTLPSTSSKQPLTGLSLLDNKSYKVSIQAADMRGNVSPPVCSGIVTVDTTKPQGGWIRDGPGADLSYQSTKLIQANWGGVTARNGVARYEWKVMYRALGSSQTTQIFPFTSINLNTRASRTFNVVRDGGKVTVTVRAYTKAGLYSDITSNGVIVDTTAPVVGKVYDGNIGGKDIKFAKWSKTFSANWKRFTDSHSPVARYQWAVKRQTAGLITAFKTVGLNRSPTAGGLNLVSGERYCAIVKGYNEAGLFSQAVSDCVLIDHDAPQAGTVNDGTGSDVDYQSVNNKMSANWNGFNDGLKGSGITEYRYKIVNSTRNDVVGWTSVGKATAMTRTGLSLNNGEKYYVVVRAVDAVGLFKDVSSDGVTADTTRPVFTGTVSVTGETANVNGSAITFVASISSLRVQWPGFSDGHSGLSYYMWAVVPRTRAATRSDFIRVPGVNLATSATFSVSLTEGAAYYVIIRAVNKAGLYKDASSVLIIPDASPPQRGRVFDGATPLVDVDYQTVHNSVRASWTGFVDPHTAIKEYKYAVGSCSPGNYHVTGNRFVSVIPPTATSFTLDRVNLVNGQKYCVKIKAKNMAGLFTAEVSSDGFTVDVTPPDVSNAKVRDGVTGSDIDYQANTTELSGEWEGIKDLQSGISFYEYGISRNRVGPPDTLGFQRVGLQTRTTISGLQLREEVYYIILCAINKAGLRKCTSSDGVLIDPTPPSKGVVHDGILEPDLRYQSLTDSIAANWEGIWDLESRVVKFEWAVGTSVRDKTSAQPFTDVGLSTHVKNKHPLALRNGQKYFVFLRTTNQAGVITELHSDGVTVDSSPPLPSKIHPGFSSDSGWLYSAVTKAHYRSSVGELAAHWDSFTEPESEIWYYKWAIGTSRCGTQVQPLINIGRMTRANTTLSELNFVAGVKYYITVVARNKAGLLSRACSEAFVFDRSAPQAGKVYIGRDPDETRKYISSSSCVISWTGFRDSQSGIGQCQIVLIREDGFTVYNNTGRTAEGQVLLSDNSLLIQSYKYYASVTCLNNAGLQSSASAPGFVIDNTPPRLEGFITVGLSRDEKGQYQSNTNTISATWPPFVDDQSPVVRYQIQIGTTPLSGDILTFYNLKGATQYTNRNLKLRHNKTYYVSIRAFNAAGLNTTVGASGLTIDLTPPLNNKVQLSDGSNGENISFISSSRSLMVHWGEITDPESGILNCKYCLGSQPLGCQMKDLTDVGKNTSFVCKGCGLKDGETTYVTVHVTNGAGLSTTSSSKGILLDDSPPTIGEVIDGSDVGGRDVESALRQWNMLISWSGAEDRQSGINDCVWSIESSKNSTMFTLSLGSQFTYGKSKPYNALRKYGELHFMKDEIYFNIIRCTNGAGLQSTTRSNGFQVVSVWPIPAAVRDGFTAGTDIAFSTSTKVVAANWNLFAANQKDPVVNYAWAVGTAAGLDNILTFTDVGLVTEVKTTLAADEPDLEVLKQGTRYFVTVRASSLSGLSSVGNSTGFFVDTTAPEPVAVVVTHQVIDQENKLINLQVSWNGIRDAESGIKESDFCLGTIQQSCLRTLLPAGRATSGTIHSFKPKPYVTYYVIVVVRNGAGLVTTLTSRKLSFDITPPSPGAVIDWYGKDIDYTNSTDTIAVEWSRFEDSESGVTKCRWSVTQKTVSYNGSHFGNDTELFHQSVKNSGQASRTGLSLIPGTKYLNAITCENADGFSVTATSDGVIVDVTPPINGRVSDGNILAKDVDYQSSTTLVQASWEPFSDLESGIVGYRWGLGTVPSSDDVISFIDVGKKTFGSKENVTLNPGVRYYVTVEATSGANMTTEAFSDGFMVDVTQPELSQLSSNNSMWLKHGEKLSATWTSSDTESGVTRTEYCVGSTSDGCQIKHMSTLLPTAESVTCHDCLLNQYTTYFMTIRLWNAAGLFTIGTTNGTRFDNTPPFPGRIHVEKTTVSCIQNCTVSGNITDFVDEESGVKSCRIAFRNSTHYLTAFTDIGLSNRVLFSGLTLAHAHLYFVEAECENKAGLVSSRVQSQRILVDVTPPTKGSVIVSEDRTHDVFGIHSGCHLYNKTLRAHWFSFNDQESGINTFRVGIGKQPFVDDVRSLTDVGITTNATMNLIGSSSLDPGDIVYVTVQAENGAGLVEKATSPPTRLVPAYSEMYMKEGDFYCINLT